MDQLTPLPFANWQNFYVIVGSCAGALTGLQFVVLTLMAQARATASWREIRAFGTPTVVHFCTALLVSSLMTAPWRSATNCGVCLGIFAALGAIYSINTFWHARKATYNPDFEDWVWYCTVPVLAHFGLIAAGVGLSWNPEWSVWGVAADTLLFLLLGIRNAWDTVTYVVVEHVAGSKNAEQAKTK
jgi:hypothetical protein